MSGIRKYPRTRHILDSRLQPGDEDLSAAGFAEIAGRHLVIEEKLDGANAAISFDVDGDLLLQSRPGALVLDCLSGPVPARYGGRRSLACHLLSMNRMRTRRGDQVPGGIENLGATYGHSSVSAGPRLRAASR
jgi:hypothetical protein